MENELTMISLTDIAKDQNNIFLSDTMTGNLQLIRLEHIGYFPYDTTSRQWEAVLCNHHVLKLKRHTNAQQILSYHPNLIQINQSCIINISYLVLIKWNKCILLSPFDKGEPLQINRPFMKKLKDRFISI